MQSAPEPQRPLCQSSLSGSSGLWFSADQPTWPGQGHARSLSFSLRGGNALPPIPVPPRAFLFLTFMQLNRKAQTPRQNVDPDRHCQKASRTMAPRALIVEDEPLIAIDLE